MKQLEKLDNDNNRTGVIRTFTDSQAERMMAMKGIKWAWVEDNAGQDTPGQNPMMDLESPVPAVKKRKKSTKQKNE